MKSLLTIVLGLCLLGMAGPNLAQAAKGNKPKKERRDQDIFAKYDANKSGVLDPDEIATLKKDFTAGTSGDLKKLDLNSNGKLDDDEIAAIMGHEMAHALREHGRERMSQAYAQQTGLSLLGAMTGMSASTGQMVQVAAQLALTLPHSRGQESEADIMGLELLARAGYNPNASVSLWQKMAQATGGGQGSFTSTHPSSNERIANLQAAIPKVMPLYEQARRQPAPTRQMVPRTAAR